MEKHKIALEILGKEVIKISGKIFADYYLRFYGNDEEKRHQEATAFLDAIMSGEGFKKEWKIEETKEYQQLSSLTATIQLLKKDL
jgi:hypothetical protein